MPQVYTPNEQWLADKIARLEQTVKALTAGRTTYAVDASGTCQAIYGNLQFDHHGNATGLGNVYGLASFKTGSWVRI